MQRLCRGGPQVRTALTSMGIEFGAIQHEGVALVGIMMLYYATVDCTLTQVKASSTLQRWFKAVRGRAMKPLDADKIACDAVLGTVCFILFWPQAWMLRVALNDEVDATAYAMVRFTATLVSCVYMVELVKRYSLPHFGGRLGFWAMQAGHHVGTIFLSVLWLEVAWDDVLFYRILAFYAVSLYAEWPELLAMNVVRFSRRPWATKYYWVIFYYKVTRALYQNVATAWVFVSGLSSGVGSDSWVTNYLFPVLAVLLFPANLYSVYHHYHYAKFLTEYCRETKQQDQQEEEEQAGVKVEMTSPGLGGYAESLVLKRLHFFNQMSNTTDSSFSTYQDSPPTPGGSAVRVFKFASDEHN